MCVTRDSPKIRTPLKLSPCRGESGQRFAIQDNGEIRTATVPTFAGFRCVEVRGGVALEGTPIQIFDCNKTASQRWRLLGKPPTCPSFLSNSPDPNFCKDLSCRCSFGQGDCDFSHECTGELARCVSDIGAAFGLPWDYDVCVSSKWPDELAPLNR